MRRAWLVLCCFLACGRPPETKSSPRAANAVATQQDAAKDAPEDTVGVDSGTPVDARTDEVALAPPSSVTRTGNVWPYHAFDRAEALTFNQWSEAQMPSGFRLEVYGELGWSPHISDRKPLTDALTKKALEILSTLGSWELTKCTLPRHAIVFYEKNVPVASINVCFTCGGIITWPPAPNPAYHGVPNATFQQQLAEERRINAVFEKLLKRWEGLFHDDVGFEVKHAW